MAGAAFPVLVDSQEKVVVVFEIPGSLDADTAEQVFRNARLAVANEHDLVLHGIVLIRRGSLPRTSSGKVRRHECADLFESQAIKAVFEWHATQDLDPNVFVDLGPLLVLNNARERVALAIQSAIQHSVAETTGADSVAPEQAFADLGLDSLAAVELSQKMESWLKIRISAVAAWSYPNAKLLANYLADCLLPEEAAAAADEEDNDLAELVAEIDTLDDSVVQDLLQAFDENEDQDG